MDQSKDMPPDGSALRSLGARLCALLDEDQWAGCERLLFEIHAEMQGMRAAAAPFVRLVTETSGRIPTERLSFANWHDLAKAMKTPNV